MRNRMSSLGRAAVRRSREAAAVGNSSSTEQRLSSSANESQTPVESRGQGHQEKDQAESEREQQQQQGYNPKQSFLNLAAVFVTLMFAPSSAQARGQRHQERDQAEEEKEQQQGYDRKQSFLNLGAVFAALTNLVQKRITDSETSHRLYDEFMQRAKRTLIYDLKETYNELYNFYNDPSMMMPIWLSESPPAKAFYIPNVDMRLESRKSEIIQDLLAFVEEQGFVCQEVAYFESARAFRVKLQLDVATVPTTGAGKHVNKMLMALESIFNV